jgi:S-adenosylhomocysteine hydrolase
MVSVDILYTFSLKRTTDVMFGGKQILICGYGEVSHI